MAVRNLGRYNCKLNKKIWYRRKKHRTTVMVPEHKSKLQFLSWAILTSCIFAWWVTGGFSLILLFSYHLWTHSTITTHPGEVGAPPCQKSQQVLHSSLTGSCTEVSRPLPGAHRRRAAGGCAARWLVRRVGSSRLPSARLHPHMLLAQGARPTRWARRRGARRVRV